MSSPSSTTRRPGSLLRGRAILLTLVILTVAVAIRVSIPDVGTAWTIVEYLVFGLSIATVVAIWDRRKRQAKRPDGA